MLINYNELKVWEKSELQASGIREFEDSRELNLTLYPLETAHGSTCELEM